MLRIVLEDTLTELGFTRNQIAVEGKIRPATLHDMVKGKVQRLDLETLEKILDTLNVMAKDIRPIDITDIIRYEPKA